MLVAQYEALRAAAAGEGLPPEARTGCCSFSAVACADGRGRWPPYVHHSGQLALGHQTGRYRKSAESSFISLPLWSSMPIITEQHHE